MTTHIPTHQSTYLIHSQTITCAHCARRITHTAIYLHTPTRTLTNGATLTPLRWPSDPLWNIPITTLDLPPILLPFCSGCHPTVRLSNHPSPPQPHGPQLRSSKLKLSEPPSSPKPPPTKRRSSLTDILNF